MPDAALVRQFSALLSGGQAEAARVFAAKQNADAPLDPYWLNAHALALHALGDVGGALNWMGRALALAPERGDFQNNYGVFLRRAGFEAEALAAYQRALALSPEDIEALRNLARALTQLGRAPEALAACLAYCAQNPGSANGHLLAGQAALAVQGWEEAARCFALAVDLTPGSVEGWRGMAQAAAGVDDLAQCEQATRKALALQPESAELHNDLGACLASAGRYDEAIAAYSKALELDPEDSKARYNRGTVRLRLGDWAEGWRDYDARIAFAHTQRPEMVAPLWDGNPLEGSLLVHAEQGLGDTLQFLRFLPLARARCQRLVFEVQPALLPLLEGCAGADQLLARGQPLPAVTARLPLLSLPGRLGLGLDDLSASAPYLPWVPEVTARGGVPRQVGLVWAGNPKHSDDRHRSIPPAALEPLLSLPGIEWHALQFGTEQIPWPGVRNRAPEIHDWRDTARLVSSFDLLLSVDTSVAHLAAALGRPVWMLIAARSDWRWMLTRSDTPWYPTVRLFRQTKPGDWRGVVASVAAALAAEDGDDFLS